MDKLKTYWLGFILSIALTLTAFIIVIKHLLTGQALIAVVVGLALIQLWVQLIFFLHLNQEQGPKWNLAMLFSTVSVILILVIGSLWIMNNLNYQHMSPEETQDYLLEEEGIHR